MPFEKVKRVMSSAAFLAEATHFARRLEDRESARSGADLSDARSTVARLSGVRSSIFENLRRGRLKSVAADIHAALRAALIADIEAELARLEHEHRILTLSSRRLDQSQIEEVEASLASLRRTLKGN